MCRLKFYLPLTLALLQMVACVSISDRYCKSKRNRFDSEGRKHGYWVSANRIKPENKIFSGWYNHGSETQRCIYYEKGRKALVLHYINDSLMRVKRYDSTGNLQYKGKALLLTNASKEEVRYCWHGTFRFYIPHHKLIKRTVYVMGEEQE